MIEAEISGGFTPLLWALGLLAFPGVLLAAQWARARRGGGRLHATGPVAHLVTIAGFMALTLIPEYNRAIDVTGDAAVIFVGTSMLLAAARGYAGCEVLAISNWLLRRDDQLGCMVFAPVDLAETQLRRRHDDPQKIRLADAAIDLVWRQDAAEVHLGTAEDNTAARRLYESRSFSNRESNGALMFFYEREL